MILADAKFDKYNSARLGEEASDGESKWQGIELSRMIVRSFAGKPDRPLYNLTVLVGDDDLTFGGISRDGLKRLATELGRLADEPWEQPT